MGAYSEIITGPMWSGKSARLIEIAEAKKSQGPILAFKPVIDTRDGAFIKSRAQKEGIPAQQVFTLREAIKNTLITCGVIGSIKAVFVDEAHLFQNLGELKLFKSHLSGLGIQVFMAGLDRDFRGLPFPLGPRPEETMQALIPHFDKWAELKADCQVCKGPAQWTQRIIDGDWHAPLIAIGSDQYEPRCLAHFTPPENLPTPQVRNG